MRSVRAAWLAAAAGLLLVASARAGEISVELSVTDHGNVKRVSDPVHGGVPFPKGYLRAADVGGLALYDRSGKPVPSFQPPVVLGTWKDGSILWAMLDFAADVPAGGKAKFTLRKGRPATARAHRIKVTEASAAYTVDTGVLKVVMNRRRFTFIEKAWVDANGDGRYSASELVVEAPGEMFIDLDDTPPGPADGGVRNYGKGDRQFFGIEGGNWMRESKAARSTRYAASKGECKVELFRRGEMHTVFRAEGWHRNAAGRNFGRYHVYVHFYAGKDSVRVLHTWIMTGDPKKNFVRRMGIALPVAPKATKYAFGGEFEKPVPGGAPLDSRGPAKVISGSVKAGGEAYILSVGPDKYYHNVPRSKDLRVEYNVHVGGARKASGHGASGWADFSDGKLGVAAGVRDFYREHPKEIGIKDGLLTLYVWPDHGGKTLDLRRRYDDVRGHNSRHGNAGRRVSGNPGSAVGVAKTTELYFRFHGGDHRSAKVDDGFRAFEDPLMPFAGGKWNCASGVLGPIAPYDPKKRPVIENFIDLSYHWQFVSQKEFSWYGMLDWGDALIEYACQHWEMKNWPRNANVYSNWGYAGWGSGFDTGQFMLTQYFRGGPYRYFRLGQAKVRHNRDLNVVHWEKPDDGPLPRDNNGRKRLGGGHRHDQQHWGTYLTGYAIPSISVGHLYYMMGEGFCLDAYRNIAQYHAYTPSIENEGRLTLAYIGEVLGERKWIDVAIEKMHNDNSCRPTNSAFGRPLVANMMGMVLADIYTEDPRIRKKCLEWGSLGLSGKQGGEGMIVMWSYLKHATGRNTWDGKIRQCWERMKPKDASQISAGALPNGPWHLAGPDAMLRFYRTKSAVSQFAAYKPWGNFPLGMLPWGLTCIDERQ